VNLRPFYAEGSKSFGYEIVEQLGWRCPAHIVVPMAGGSLVTKIGKAFGELDKLGLIATGSARKTKIHGAQAAGCAPIVDMVLENREQMKPVRTPTSIAKSLAIGNPADGFYARQTIIGSGGFAAKPDDDEIVAAMRLLAETEGIFTETAGGVTLGATMKLIASGRIGKDDGPIVISVTGNGMKTQDPLVGKLPMPALIGPSLADFDKLEATISK
jgi:threonine synthase